MGKRGPKPKFNDVACPNEDCEYYGLTGKGNVVGNGTYQIKGKRIRKYFCRKCGRVFCDRTNTFFYDLRKDESIILLALKMSIKGMSIEAIADVLEVQPVTVRSWLSRAAIQCEKVHQEKMKNLDIPKVEMDELWTVVKKK
jgi:transposase-like protein